MSTDGHMVFLRRLPLRSADARNTGRPADFQLLLLCLAREYGVAAAEAQRLQQDVYQFTAADIRTGQYLMSDMTVTEIAEQAGIKVSTVRTQVQSMLQKAGLRRQAELVRLLSAIYVVEPAQNDDEALC